MPFCAPNTGEMLRFVRWYLSVARDDIFILTSDYGAKMSEFRII
jgi:hypothetical protein